MIASLHYDRSGFEAKNDKQLSFFNAFSFTASLRYDRSGFEAKNDKQLSFFNPSHPLCRSRRNV